MAASHKILVVMAGGSGTRFWPKSTSKRPKQLLSFGKSKEPLIAQTLARFRADQAWILTTQALEPAVREAAGSKPRILAEPQGRNTAPCIYWAAREAAKVSPDALMMVMPSDHLIADLPAFQKTVDAACAWALAHDDLVTLGIKPSRPETGYGYLKVGKTSGSGAIPVEAFVEKPNLERAKEFVSKGYLWNGGMFIWRASVILRAFDELMPEMKKAWDSSKDAVDAYPKLTATSIDFGVMEKAENVVSFPLDCGWDDIGNWTSLESVADALGARVPGGVATAGELLSIDSARNIVDVPGKLVALLGVEDLIVAESDRALLITTKEKAQDIRKVVEELKKTRPELV